MTTNAPRTITEPPITLEAAPTVPDEPVAYMFTVKFPGGVREFAAIDHYEQKGETIVSKEPLVFRAQLAAAEAEFRGAEQEMNWQIKRAEKAEARIKVLRRMLRDKP